MATITLTIPDVSLPRVRSALCINAGMTVSNANAKLAVILLVKQVMKEVEYSESIKAQPPIVIPSDIIT